MSGDAEQFDVVIVGARCAGSPLATMLARRGLRVCLLDRSRFPSDSLSTHVIQPCGVQVLERLGVLDAAFAAGGGSRARGPPPRRKPPDGRGKQPPRPLGARPFPPPPQPV